MTPVGWKRPLLFGFGSVYGPFLVMAVFMGLCVPCAHCKEAAFTILPAAPGYASVGLLWRALFHDGPTQSMNFVLGTVVGVLSVAVVALTVRRGGRVALILPIVALASFTFVAIGTAALIRM